MSNSSQSRRDFIATTSIGLIGAAAIPAEQAPTQNPSEPTAGAPPAFGGGPAFGPEVSTNTFAEAEKLVQFELRPDEQTMAAESWRRTLASVYERRVGPRKVAIESPVAPYSQWNPVLPGHKAGPARERFLRLNTDPGPLPDKEDDIAFAPLTKLSRWIEQRKLKSERLTQIYLKRIERFDPKPGLFYEELAERLEERRRYEPAEQYYKKALALRPLLPGTGFSFAVAAFAYGDIAHELGHLALHQMGVRNPSGRGEFASR